MSLLDLLINEVDKGLKYSTQNYQTESRPYPASKIEQGSLNEFEKNHSAGLMRVNHSGEVCAQALYRGQAITAKLVDTKDKMEQAASEELDHLSWCNRRLEELDSKPSILNPIWYGMSFSIGAIAGLIGDKWSLGFVHETEEQVQLARRYYNGTVRDWNVLVESFPSNLIAGIFRFQLAEFFEIELATERTLPKVDF